MFHYFTINFTSLFSLLFAYFRFTWVIFASKRNKAKWNSSQFFRFFSLFSLFSAIFRIFSHFFHFFSLLFAVNFSLRFDLVIFASMRNKAFFHFFWLFFRFFHFISLNFRFASIFSFNFRLFYLRFRFRFLVFRIEVNHVKSGFFFASKRNEIFTSISNCASEAKVRAHPSKDILRDFLLLV